MKTGILIKKLTAIKEVLEDILNGQIDNSGDEISEIIHNLGDLIEEIS